MILIKEMHFLYLIVRFLITIKQISSQFFISLIFIEIFCRLHVDLNRLLAWILHVNVITCGTLILIHTVYRVLQYSPANIEVQVHLIGEGLGLYAIGSQY